MTDTTPSGADKRAKKAKKAKPAREETTSRTTLADEIRDVIAEAREAFASEINFQKARAALAGKYAGGIAVMGVLALIVARLLASFEFAPYALLSDSSYRAEIARRVNGMEADIAFVKAIHGRAACSVMTVCYLAGKPYDLKAPPLILRGEDRWSPKS